MQRCERLPAVERAAVELVDLEGLTPKEAALALGVSRVAFRQTAVPGEVPAEKGAPKQ